MKKQPTQKDSMEVFRSTPIAQAVLKIQSRLWSL